MALIAQGKTNWKYILIVAVLAFVVGGGILSYTRYFKKEIISLTKFSEIKKPERIVEEKEACFNGELKWKPYSALKEITDKILQKIIIQQIIKEFKECDYRFEERICDIKNFEISGEKIDLNNDGFFEYIIYPQEAVYSDNSFNACLGGSGGGPIYIFGFIQGEWKLIGDSFGAWAKTIKSRWTKGYVNLASQLNMGVCCHRIFEYAWDGERYELIKTVDWGEGSANPLGPPEEYLELWEGMACLAKGTKILMSDEGHKEIENIQKGDSVKSFDIKTKKFKNTEVIRVIKRKDPIININDLLKTAPDGIVYLANGDTKKAVDLKIGDYLLNENGENVRVDSIKYMEERIDTYDLILKDSENFFADGYLVHTPK